MQPVLKMFWNPLWKPQKGTSCTPLFYVHPQAVLPSRSATLFTLLVPKGSFQELNPPLLKKDMPRLTYHMELQVGEEGLLLGDNAHSDMYPLFTRNKGYSSEYHLVYRHLEKHDPHFPGADNPKETTLMPRKEMDTKTADWNCQIHGQNFCTQRELIYQKMPLR